MKRIYKYLKDLPHIMKAEIAIAIMLTALIALSLPSLAWFSGSRKLGDLERIDTPTKLFITASERDDIKYLQLTDIKVSNSQEHKKYYVFCVSGESATGAMRAPRPSSVSAAAGAHAAHPAAADAIFTNSLRPSILLSLPCSSPISTCRRQLHGVKLYQKHYRGSNMNSRSFTPRWLYGIMSRTRKKRVCCT